MDQRITLPKKKAFGIALAALLTTGAMLLGPSAQRVQAATTCPNADVLLGALTRSQIQFSIACLLNEARYQRGLAPLASHRKLYKAARFHNKEMQTRLHRLTHRSANGENLVARIRRFYARGASSWKVGEIIADRYGVGATANVIVKVWLDSPIHYPVITDRRFIHFGVAARKGTANSPNAYGALVTVDFGFRSG